MKAFITILCGVFVAAASAAEFQMYGGKLYNVDAAKDWVRLEGYFTLAISNGITAEKLIYKKQLIRPPVDSLARDNRFVGGAGSSEISFYDEAIHGPPIFIRNFPKTKAMAFDDQFSCIAIKAGVKEVAGQIYELWDCGRPATQAEIQAELAKRKSDLDVKVAEKQNAESSRLASPKVVAYQLDRASNGYPSFQFEVGKRYLNGDGVEKDLTLARHWLKSACTNGMSEATNLLGRIP